MSYRILLGIASPDLATEAAALIKEEGDLEVVDTSTDAGGLIAALGVSDVDAVMLHEDLGPLPAMDLARDIGVRYPHVGLVLIVRERTPEVLRAALQAGFRDVLSVPLAFEELQSGLRGAAAWSHAVKERIASEGSEEDLVAGGTMIAVAGAKGGVGTTTTAVRLALEAARSGANRAVCLVDFDLQAGDVAIMLDLSHRRSVFDLFEVAEEITPRQLEETLYAHPSGLRVLLAPSDGEQAEEVRAGVARQILGAIKFRFDIVIVDVGTVVTEGNAVAIEMADEVLAVTTPDVPALRAANRLIAMWERLQVRKADNVKIVVNRVNKSLEVQPDLVRKVVNSPLAKVVIPSGFKDLEPAVNTGVPDRLGDGALRKAFVQLGREVNALPGASERRRMRLRAAHRESGQIAIETMGMTAIILLTALLLWQVVLTGTTFWLAGHAAREGARELAVGGDVEGAVAADLWPAWRDGMRIEEGDESVTVDLPVPLVIPGLTTDFRIEVEAGTVVEKGSSFP
jgi:pilus assembly protein CpaE